MTAALRAPRYFVLIVDGQPLIHEGSQNVPVIFHNEETALATGRHMQVSRQTQAVSLESYGDDYRFLGRSRIEGTAPLVIQQA